MATATATRKPARKPARKARKASEETAPRADAYQLITDKMIELMEAGTTPWHQPWDAVVNAPLSMSTKKAYRGINIFLLQATAAAKGYSSPWWGTYTQIKVRGGQVRKDEKGAQVILWKTFPIKDEKTEEVKRGFSLRTFYVFNAEQVEGDLKLPAVEPRPEVDSIAECEAALASYYSGTGPTLRWGLDAAYYTPSADTVSMPAREQFHSSEEFYGTWFHETVHSTGHESRLARPDLLTAHRFGDESYSKEELVAEMGAAFLAAHTGIAATTMPSSAAYLKSWIAKFRDDKKMLISAAAQAQKAVELILGVTHDEPATETAD